MNSKNFEPDVKLKFTNKFKWILGFAAVAMITTISIGACNDNSKEVKAKKVEKPLYEYQFISEAPKLLYKLLPSFGGNGYVFIYLWRTPDGCQYEGTLTHSSSDYLSHYGLCDNPKHRADYKPDTVRKISVYYDSDLQMGEAAYRKLLEESDE